MSKNPNNNQLNGYEEKIHSLHTGAALIGRANSTTELYNAILKTMIEILGYPRSGLGIPDDDRMKFVVNWDGSNGPDFWISLDTPSISNRAYKEKKTQIVNDVREDPDYFKRAEDTPAGKEILSSLNVPVLVDREVRAVIILESFELNTFSQMDADILEILGMHISSAFTRIDQVNEIYESETRVQALMTQAADSIILMDDEDRIIFWNPAAERLFNYPMREAVGKTFSGLLVPDEYKDKYIRNRMTLLGREDDSSLPTMECVCRKKTGEHVIVEVSQSKVYYDGVPHVLRMIRDASERKKYEERLESLHRSAILLNSAQTKDELFEITISIIKEVLGILWVGIAEPTEVGMRIALSSAYNRDEDLLFPFEFNSVILRSYREKKTVYVEDITRDPDYIAVERNIQYTSELVVPVFVNDEVTALINVEATKKEDLTELERELVEILALYMGSAIERIKRTKELRESEERIRILSQNAADAIFVVNRNREFVIWNKSMVRMFGLEGKDFGDKKLENLIVPEERWEAFYDEFDGIIERRIETGDRVLESVARRMDGTELQVGYTTAVIDLDGVPHALFIMRDITEQKAQRDKIIELNMELERSNRDLESYTYVVSHDLKAPLRSIRSFSGFLMEDYAQNLDGEAKEYLDRIINASTHMDNLISDLLVLSRVGRKFTEVEKVPLSEMVNGIEEEIYVTIKERNARIIKDDLPTVTGQKTWIRQLFMNLITNGLKFNQSESPTITIRVNEDEPQYTFSVKDNGIGIATEYHDKIFQLFERLHTNTEYEGTGAGLAICKKIVDDFGGRIWVESSVGEGSTFYFTYPKEEMGA